MLVDRDNGVVKLTGYIAVDDFGTVINPMIVDGQVHGGLAQGIGAALWEEAVYDPSGQMVTGSFMDYAMPKACQLPDFTLDRLVTPTLLNPLGAEGMGESPTVAATPAVVNALSPFGISHLDMPLTPENVWRAIQDSG